MKLAIKVLTEWDRKNVIPFFEKHYPNCNKLGIKLTDTDTTYAIVYNNWLGAFNHKDKFLSDYTILEGVPTDMGMPSDIKTREQELEECLRELMLFVDEKNSTFEVINGFRVSDILTKAKQLLDK